MEILTIILLLAVGVYGHSCKPCDKSNCAIPTGCAGGITYDACRCCQVCARQVNETCGGWYGMEGACDVGLKCVTTLQPGQAPNEQAVGTCKHKDFSSTSERCRELDFEGCNAIGTECKCSSVRACTNPFQFADKVRCSLHLITIEKSKKNCSNQRCEIRYTPACPHDSELAESRWPAGECCPLPATCRCRKNSCKPRVCPRGYEKVLVQRGTQQPGKCCDYFRCKRENDCSDITCPTFDRIKECANDSIMITDRIAKDGCCELPPKCRCRSIVCTETACPDGTRSLVVAPGNGRPGSCCDKIRCVKIKPEGSCRLEGRIYKHGENFHTEPCVSCNCRDGVYHCSREQCPKLDCARQYTPDGRCCPRCKIILQEQPTTIRPYRVCMDSERRMHLPGDAWHPDPCTTCVCKDTGPRCIASSCQKNCENPVRVEGECCGVCPEPTFITLPNFTCPSMKSCNLTGAECPFGFQSDDLGCRLCECRKKSAVCKSMDSCSLNCPKGLTIDGVGCEICRCRGSKPCRDIKLCDKDCPFGFRVDRNGCKRCKCRRCADIVATCVKKCKYGRVVNKYGCKICKCRPSSDFEALAVHSIACSDDGVKRDDGERWKSATGHQCLCRHGTTLCDVAECPIPHCDKPIVRNGSSCAVCADSEPSQGDQLKCVGRVEGESWEADQSTSCACNSAFAFCSFETCKPASCEKPRYTEDHVCPTCPDEPSENLVSGSYCVDGSGKPREPGSSWRQDKCNSCKCVDGEIRCFGEKCPQVHNCENPVVKRGQCCPQCLGDPETNICFVGDRNYTHGEIWSTSPSGCESCSCIHGAVKCMKEICHPVPDECSNIVHKEGECCAICQELKTAATTPVAAAVTTELANQLPGNLVTILASAGGAVILFAVLGIAACFIVKSNRRKYQRGREVGRPATTA